jgi:hypothetical protein
MPISEPHQLELPPEFPLAAFEQFFSAARERLPQSSVPRSEFNGACNIIGWRFRSAIEYANGFLESWSRVGVRANFEEQYERERALFGMFSCGVAALEAVCYASHAVSSVITPPDLDFDERARRRSNPQWLRDQLIQRLPGHALTETLSVRLGAQEWKLWLDLRNTMTHRANIPRTIFASMGSAPPPARLLEFPERWSHAALTGDETEFRRLTKWLAEAMSDVMTAATRLATGT